MTTADLGYPLLLFILFFWGVFALTAFLNTLIKKGNLKNLKEFFRRMLDPSPHHKHTDRLRE
jgi:hypothetical protein